MVESNEHKNIKRQRRLPRVLIKYEDSDFTIQQKARFVYHLCISIIVGLVLIIISSSYIQIYDPSYSGLNLTIIIPLFVLLILFVWCLFLLTSGHYNFSANLILITSLSCIWYVMWTDKTEAINRMDTIAFIFAILSTTPLFVNKNKYVILIYSSINVLILFLFVFSTKDQLAISNFSALDYLIDSTIGIVFLGIVAYNIFRINKNSLEQVEIDTKQRRDAEIALLKSENRYGELTNLLPQSVFEMDIKGNLTYINKTGFNLYGLTEEDLLSGINVLSTIAEEDHEIASKNIERLFQGETNLGNQYTAVKKDGTKFPVQIYSSIVLENNKPIGLRGIVVDITERKNAENEIRKSRDQYESLVLNIPGITYRCLFDKDWTMIFISSEIEKLSGYPPTDFINNKFRSFESIINKEDTISVTKTIEDAIRSDLPWEDEYRINHRDGSIHWVYEKGRAIKDLNGKVEYLDGFILDITDRKRLDELLHESELHYKTLVETSQDGISLADLSGNLLFVNKRKVELLRASSETDLVGKNLLNLLTINSRSVMAAAIPKIIAKGYMDGIEVEVERIDGTTFPADFSISALKDNNGNPKYLMDTMRDISRRKAQQESEKKYQFLMENMNEAVMLVDDSDRIRYVNKSFTKKLGYTPEEIVGEIGFKFLYDPRDKEIVTDPSKRKVTDENQYELTFASKEGQRISFLISAAPVRDYEGVANGSIITMVDITERKLALEALKQSEERYRTIIEAFPDSITISDLEGNLIFGNEPFERITGITQKDYSNPNRKAHIHPDDIQLVKNAVKDLLVGNKTHTEIIENRFVDSWGKTHWLSGIISKITLNNQTVLQTITRDITEKKEIEKELEGYRSHLELLVNERTEELATANEELTSTNEELYYQRKELEEALSYLQNAQKQLIQSEKMASIGILSAGVAHEINNPLNFISGGILGIENYFNESLSDHAENVAMYIDAVNTGVSRAAEIVKSLNRFSRQTDSTSENCDLHSIIDSCLVILHNETKNRITIEKNYTTDNYSIKGNEGKLHQAALNILTNAVHAIDNKGIIKISTLLQNREFVLAITDSGHGIDNAHLEKIFDPFFTTKEPGKGTGLGLAITYQIIKDIGGNIEYFSEKGKGTTAKISIPVS